MNLTLWLRQLRRTRTHRVTTVTRTVTREPGESPQEEVVREEETVEPQVTAVTPVAMHISIAVMSVMGVTVMAFVLGWLIRHWND